MKISVEEVSRLLAYAPSERTGNRSGNALTSEQSNTSDGRPAASVEVSPTAQEVNRIAKLIEQMPDTRTDRVQALKTQIENGTYHVSGEDIADLIIRRTLADNTAL